MKSRYSFRDSLGRFAKLPARPCAYCKKARPWKNKKYCSFICRNKAYAIEFPKADPKNVDLNFGTIQCKWCKKIFTKRWRVHTYCAKPCRDKSYARRLRYMRIMDNKRREIRGEKKRIQNESVKDFFIRLKKEREQTLEEVR